MLWPGTDLANQDLEKVAVQHPEVSVPWGEKISDFQNFCFGKFPVQGL